MIPGLSGPVVVPLAVARCKRPFGVIASDLAVLDKKTRALVTVKSASVGDLDIRAVVGARTAGDVAPCDRQTLQVEAINPYEVHDSSPVAVAPLGVEDGQAHSRTLQRDSVVRTTYLDRE